MHHAPPALNRPGVYALLLLPRGAGDRLRIGAGGEFVVETGQYLYVGTAHGPGGLRGRLLHHLRPGARAHWHIDYLRAVCDLHGAWIAYGPAQLEHRWAKRLLEMPGASAPMPGFGASDCRCCTHLVRLPSRTSRRAVSEGLAARGSAPRYCHRRDLERWLDRARPQARPRG